MAPKKTSKNQLGKTLIRSRFGNNRPKDNDTTLFTTEVHEGPKWMKLQSITQENDLDAFLRNAEMAGTEFTAERTNVKIISTQPTAAGHNPFLLTPEQERDMLAKIEDNRDKLTVPRRPHWDTETTSQQLQKNERDAFLEWRAQLAYLEEDMGMVLTPFERNLEVWRQLWRVIERSDIVVQIVDARNPLFFRSEDLETYVHEVDETKRNLLLINKADFLTEGQRREWAAYFQQEGISFLFFSAAQSNEQLEKQESASSLSPILNNQSEIDFVNSSEEDSRSPTPTEEEEGAKVVIDELESSVKNTTSLENVTFGREPWHVLSCEEMYEHFLQLKDESKEQITVGLVGYPNVGKSSTINALVGSKCVNVSSTPGKTKHFQTIVLSPEVILCDCPGLVFPSFATTKADMVVNGVLPIDQLREYTGPSALVAQRIPKYFLESLYGIHLPDPREGEDPNRPPTASELTGAYAIARGFRTAGQGNPHESRAARFILKDYVNGKLLYVHAPPSWEGKEREFNNKIYEKGGIKFELSQRALDKKTRAEEHDAAADQTKKPSQAFDKEFVNAGASTSRDHVRAHVKGKFHQVTPQFRRVNYFPHQSAYTMDVSGGVGGSVGGSTMASAVSSSALDIAAAGKKHHKEKKKRTKDRSWRAWNAE